MRRGRAGIFTQQQQRAKTLLLASMRSGGARRFEEFIELIGQNMELRHARVYGFLPGGKFCKTDAASLRLSRADSKAVSIQQHDGFLAAGFSEALGRILK